jgi:hypothetical protein
VALFGAESGAAPATVSGERRSFIVSLACAALSGDERAGKAWTDVTTREPGDLPRQITSSGGVPGQVASQARSASQATRARSRLP